MSEDFSTLLPCPFCGAGEFRVTESRLNPTMERPVGTLISVTLLHWCEKPAEGIRSGVTLTAKTQEEVTAMWNRRVG